MSEKIQKKEIKDSWLVQAKRYNKISNDDGDKPTKKLTNEVSKYNPSKIDIINNNTSKFNFEEKLIKNDINNFFNKDSYNFKNSFLNGEIIFFKFLFLAHIIDILFMYLLYLLLYLLKSLTGIKDYFYWISAAYLLLSVVVFFFYKNLKLSVISIAWYFILKINKYFLIISFIAKYYNNFSDILIIMQTNILGVILIYLINNNLKLNKLLWHLNLFYLFSMFIYKYERFQYFIAKYLIIQLFISMFYMNLLITSNSKKPLNFINILMKDIKSELFHILFIKKYILI